MTELQATIARNAVGILLLMMLIVAGAQDLYVYPANGQSDDQLSNDRYACHTWAVEESGFDPTQYQDPAPPRTVRVPIPENESEGATTKGTLAGAVVGAAIGAHNDDTVEGAVIGAAVGTLAGAAIEEQGAKQAREQAKADGRQKAEELAHSKIEQALARSNYRRALTACLEGKGYTVK